MAENELNVKFGADATEFNDAIEKLNKKVAALEKQLKEAGNSEPFDNLGKQVEKTAGKISRVSNAVGSQLGGVAGEVAEVTGAVAELGSEFSKAGISLASFSGPALVALGALAVGVAVFAAAWEDVKKAITGVDGEYAKQTKRLQRLNELQDAQLSILRNSRNQLRLQGKGEREINNILIGRLQIRAQEQKAVLDRLKTELQQELSFAQTLANGLAKLFGPGAGASFFELVSGDVEQLSGEILEAEKALNGFKEEIAGLQLANFAERTRELKQFKGVLEGIKPPGFTEDFTKLFDFALPDPAQVTQRLKELADAYTLEQFRQKQLEELRLTAEATRAELEAQQLEAQRQSEAIFAGALSGVFDSIGQALAQGQNVFAAAGRSILSSISGLLSQLGDKFLIYGIAASAFGKSLASLATFNPLTIIKSAGGLIAAGAALKLAGSAIGSLASGGGSGGGGGAIGGGASDGNIVNNIGGGNLAGRVQEVVFRINGQELLGVLRNVSNSNDRLAGVQTLRG